MKRTLLELVEMPRMGTGTPLSDIHGNTNSVKGLIDLVNHIGGLSNKTMVEIGCFSGVSTETFLQFNPIKLYAIDIWGLNPSYRDCKWLPGGQPNFNVIESTFREMAKNYDNVEIIKNFSKYASFGFHDKSLDFVYIDGEHKHTAITEDIEHWLPKVKIGGYISGHDGKQSPVINAVRKILKVETVQLFDDTSWLVKIPSNL